jgi:hypothetical protein
MNKVQCGFVCLLLCLLLSAGFVVPRCTQVAERAAATRGEQFGPIPDVIRARILAKDLLVEELASGRLTLFDAAALFRELDGMHPMTVYPTKPNPDAPIRLECPTEDERYCVWVITFARNSLRSVEPVRARIVTERLVAELEAERRLPGAIRLPGPGSLGPARELLRRRAHVGLSAPGTTTAPGEDP